MEVHGCYQFRVTRNSDLFVDEEEVEDLRARSRASWRSGATATRCGSRPRTTARRTCATSCCSSSSSAPERSLPRSTGPVNLNRLIGRSTTWSTAPDLKYPPFTPGLPRRLAGRQDMFEAIREKRRAAAPPVPVLRAGGRLHAPGGGRPARARDQADAVPHRHRLADRRRAGRRPRTPARKSRSSSSCGRASTRKPTSSSRTACRRPARTSCTASSATRPTPRW